MALKAPRLVGSGMAEIKACEGIIRENIPANRITLATITQTSGT